jgi:hypothetical protein
MLDGGGHHFGCVLNGSFTTGDGGVCGHVSGTSCGYFGRLLCWGLESGVRVVQEWIVVPASRDLGRDEAGQGKTHGEDLNWMEN